MSGLIAHAGRIQTKDVAWRMKLNSVFKRSQTGKQVLILTFSGRLGQQKPR
ncbi:MAG: hypothetical protein MRK00_01575 [Nitrosomonas sp.]|nr:hypothetical protein [Nitrosomonas sp.]